MYDLFNVWQREGETPKDLNRFWVLTVRLQTHDENVMVTAFEHGVAAESFTDSLIRNPTETFPEIRIRFVAHINAEEAVAVKNGNSYSRLSKSKESGRASRPLRVNETSTGKKVDSRHASYGKGEPKTKSKEEEEFRPKFRISYKELIAILEVAKVSPKGW